jgi:hypothetical protein
MIFPACTLPVNAGANRSGQRDRALNGAGEHNNAGELLLLQSVGDPPATDRPSHCRDFAMMAGVSPIVALARSTDALSPRPVSARATSSLSPSPSAAQHRLDALFEVSDRRVQFARQRADELLIALRLLVRV